MIQRKNIQKTLVCGLIFAAFLAVSASAWSAEDTISARSERTEEEVSKGLLEREIVGVKPQLGLMVFNNAVDETDSRLAAALIVEMNAITSFFKDNQSAKNWYIGPSTGVVYSHLGNPNSNFFGTESSTQVGQAGSNFLMVPVNLKLGYLFPESNFRLSVRAGGNVTYRSVADSINFGTAAAGPGSIWRMYPNIGADFELGGLTIRPDLTLTPESEVFTGTVGYNISLG